MTCKSTRGNTDSRAPGLNSRPFARENFPQPLPEHGFLFEGQRTTPPDPVKSPSEFLALIRAEAG
jgi:hypothetical protein